VGVTCHSESSAPDEARKLRSDVHYVVSVHAA
jgi:hypothetical protein